MTGPRIGDRVHAAAPVRVADVGGWTDTWFGSPGQVCHLAVGPGVAVDAALVAGTVPSPQVRLLAPSIGLDRWFDPRELPGAEPLLEHAVAAVLDDAPIPEGADLVVRIASAVPPGASLGTSASVLVALLAALDALLAAGGRPPDELARLAHHVETERAGRQAGVQDQWAAAFGGCELLAIGPYPDVRRTAVALDPAATAALADRLVTVVFGPHDSSAVHGEVIESLLSCSPDAHDGARQALRRLSSLAGDAAAALGAGDVDAWAGVLVASVAEQEALHPGLVGEAHRAAIAAAQRLGAVGWKVNGAGGAGGSLTVVAGDGPGALRGTELGAALALLDPAWQVVALAPAPGLRITRR